MSLGNQPGAIALTLIPCLAHLQARSRVNAIPYHASKGGVIAFTRDLACKWARHGINVNAIAPGWFPSDMSRFVLERSPQIVERIPLRRFGGPDDLKGAILYLASAASDYVTGHTVVVDGGQSAW